MNVEYTGRHTTVSKKLKTQAEAGLASIAKLAGRSASAHVILTEDKYRKIAEVTVMTRGQSLVATCESTEMATALHDALAKIEQQAVRHNQKSNTLARHPKKGIKQVAEESFQRAAEEGVAAASPAKPAKKAAKKSRGGNKSVAEVQSFGGARQGGEPHVLHAAGHDTVAERPMSLEQAVKHFESRDLEIFVFRDLSGQAMVLHCRRDEQLEVIEVPAA